MTGIDTSSTSRSLREAALIAASLGVVAVPLALFLTPVSPVSHFDVDPRSEVGRAANAAIGPTLLAWLHVLAVLVSAGAMAVHAAVGGRVRIAWCALAAVGVVAALWHVGGATEQRLTMGAWVSGASLAIAAAHLATHEVARRWMFAALLAALLPAMLQALFYVLVEHPMTVEHFEAGKAETLASRGWAADSPQALAYERRLTDPAATGAFGLSNVFASIVGSLAVAAAVWSLIAWPARDRGSATLAAAIAACGAVALVLTQSKGGIAAAGAGLLLAGISTLPLRRHVPSPTLRGAIVLLIVCAFASVIVRGMVGPPETWEGERSLLFRWHYWQAAAAMPTLASPTEWLLGLGTLGFQALYLVAKNPINPEEVQSAHNVFVDWLAMLGGAGAAWCALALWMPLSGAAGATREQEQESAATGPWIRRGDLLAAAPLVVFAFGIGYAVRVHQLWIDSVLVWLVGAAGYLLLVALLVGPRGARGSDAVRLAAVVAAATLLIHSQIEMAFFNLPAAPMAWLLVGLAGAGARLPQRAPEPRPGVALVPAVALGFTAVALLVWHAVPTTRTEARASAAASALQSARPLDAMVALDAAASLSPADTRLLRWRLQLRLEWANGLARAGTPERAKLVLDDAERVLREALDRQRGPAAYRLLSSLLATRADALREPPALRGAVDARREAIARAPYNLDDQRTLAEMLVRLGDTAPAADAYRRTLEISDFNYLDPVRQLSAEERADIEARIRSMSGG